MRILTVRHLNTLSAILIVLLAMIFINHIHKPKPFDGGSMAKVANNSEVILHQNSYILGQSDEEFSLLYNTNLSSENFPFTDKLTQRFLGDYYGLDAYGHYRLGKYIKPGVWTVNSKSDVKIQVLDQYFVRFNPDSRLADVVFAIFAMFLILLLTRITR